MLKFINVIKKQKKIMKYTTDGKCEVFTGKKVIARSYVNVSTPGYEVRILQGMPRFETIKKICEDCPEFAKANNIIG